jgi:hypothetical protein
MVAYPTGTVLASSQYAPASQTSITMTGTVTPAASMAAWDTNNIFTGPFTAPASGNVLVQVSYSAKTSAPAAVCVVGLCAHGTVSPMVGVTSSFQVGSTSGNITMPLTYQEMITGLTPGASYNYDFMGACFTSTATFILIAQGLTGTVTGGTAGSPVSLTVWGL